MRLPYAKHYCYFGSTHVPETIAGTLTSSSPRRSSSRRRYTVWWRSSECHRCPACPSCRDPLVETVREFRLEVRLKAKRSRPHIPGAVLLLRLQQELDASFVCGIRTRQPRSVQRKQSLSGRVRVAFHRGQVRPAAVGPLCRQNLLQCPLFCLFVGTSPCETQQTPVPVIVILRLRAREPPRGILNRLVPGRTYQSSAQTAAARASRA